MSRLWIVIALAGSGCAYKVAITASPSPALAELPNGKGTVSLPADVTFRWVPFGKQQIRVSADGYRPVELDLRRREIRWSRYVTDTLFRPATLFGRPRGEVRVILVPDHGPVGTWSEQDVP